MKKLFVLLFISLLTFTTVSAATTISTDITTSGKVGIGSTTPYSKLSIDASGSDINPFSIKTNGSAGNYTHANSGIFMYDAAGVETLRIVATDPDDYDYNSANLFIGKQAGLSHPVDNLTAGFYNTGIGYIALYSDTTGQSNTAVGAYTLNENTTGSSNTANGAFSLTSNTTGSGNTASGYSPLGLNRTGSGNTSSGYSSMYYNNSATSTTSFGYNAGVGTAIYHNQGGVYVGYQSGYSAGNDSDYNTLIGYRSGYGITTGKNNIVLGTATSSTSVNNITTGSQNILIGNNIGLPSATASGQLNIGNIIFGRNITSTGTTISSGNIGIGTTTPATKLHVSSGASATTTVSIGELGLSSSKACVNMNRSDGGAGSFYINAAGAGVFEANYCR